MMLRTIYKKKPFGRSSLRPFFLRPPSTLSRRRLLACSVHSHVAVNSLSVRAHRIRDSQLTACRFVSVVHRHNETQQSRTKRQSSNRPDANASGLPRLLLCLSVDCCFFVVPSRGPSDTRKNKKSFKGVLFFVRLRIDSRSKENVNQSLPAKS